MSNPSAQLSVLQAVRQWQTRLLQLDRRNPLLYFPIGKRGVTVVGHEADSLIERLASSRSGLSFPYAERARSRAVDLFNDPLASQEESAQSQVLVRAGDLATDIPPLELQKRLGALSRRNREWQEEQGLNVLYLAFGFLQWIDEDQEPACSPLLLLPCDLTRESPRDPFILVGDEAEEVVVNPTLRHKLSTATAIHLSEAADESVVDYWKALERLIQGRDGWRVDRSIVLSTFPFSKLAMWEDLDRIASSGVSHPLVRRLAGDTESPINPATGAGNKIPNDEAGLSGARLDDLLDIRDQFAVLDADFSQLRAIEMARCGSNLVVHGPPGTGKSQTIANIVSTLLAHGHRVLFVSEKTAALDVVKRRLTEVGLGDFCLDLHSDRAKKTSVYAQLRRSKGQSRSVPRDFPYDRLQALRSELNSAIRALHAVRKPLDFSVFAIHGRIAEIGDVPRLDKAVRDVQALDATRLREIEIAVASVARRPTEFHQHFSSRWNCLGSIEPSPLLETTLKSHVGRLRAAVEMTETAASAVTSASGALDPGNVDQVERLLRIASHLAVAPAAIPPSWLEFGGLKRARECAELMLEEANERQELITAVSPFLSHMPSQEKLDEGLRISQSIASNSAQWSLAIGTNWSSLLLADPRSTAAVWSARAEKLSATAAISRQVQTELGIQSPLDTFSAAEAAAHLSRRLLTIGTVPSCWSDARALVGLRSEIAKARALLAELDARKQALAKDFDPDIVERVSDEMLARFRTDYKSLLRRLSSLYRRDRRLLKSCLRRPKSMSLDLATSAIEQALSVKRLRAEWKDLSPRLAALFGERFKGHDTDWAEIESDLGAVAIVFRDNPMQSFAIHSLLVSQTALSQLGQLSQSLSRELGTVGAYWTGVSPPLDGIIDLATRATEYARLADNLSQSVDELGPFEKQPHDLDALATLLVSGARLASLEATAQAESGARSTALGHHFREWATNLGEIRTHISWAEEFLEISPPPLPSAMADRLLCPTQGSALSGILSNLATCLAALRDAWAVGAPLISESHLPWGDWTTASFAAIREWCEGLHAHATEANSWLEYRAAASRLDNLVGAGIVDATRGVTDNAALVPGVILRHVYLLWLEIVYRQTPELQTAPTDLEAITREFRELDSRLPAAARERVRERCLTSLEGMSNAQRMGELGVLNHQLSLRRRQLPVRKLVQRIPNLLQKLKPCFMMSPLAVSQYLPRGASEAETLSFDTVIFDEASQVFPEDAIPAIARGRQSIVVGDQQQLPPTSYFRSEEATEAELDDDDDEPTQNRLENVESILDVLVGMRGAGVEDAYLDVHYRSEHDTLIRYSNHYFYDDRLLTFPALSGARHGLGVRSEYVPNGRFEAGGSRTNRIEAERVAGLLFSLLGDLPPSESVGVVAFSRAQADLIQTLIDTRRLSNRQFDDRFSEEATERFFVKNLENVQGDERDHIILSVGYGPTAATGLVPNRFGPINKEGGHRRLNVAVSRARKSVTVVHSLRPEDIHSTAQGPQLLRRYLEFLRSGEASIEGSVLEAPSGEAESPFEDAVGRALERRGYRIQRQVGCFKYSIDLVVLSEDGKSFDLGIECDGATFHSSPSARDRDRIRQEMLERLGWRGRIHRVWSTAWIRNAKKELDAIEHAIQVSRDLPRDSAGPPRVATRPFETESDSELSPRDVSNVSFDSAVGEIPLFEPYVEASLSSFPRVPDVREASSTRVAELVETVVRAEAPVHIDIVIERIRIHFWLQRAGRVVREAILAGTDVARRREQVRWLPISDVTLSEGEFLIPAGEWSCTPRGVARGGGVRLPEHICDNELECGTVLVVRSLVGASRSDVITATARAFGYARTGANIEERMSKAVDRLLGSGKIVERVGSLVLPD